MANERFEPVDGIFNGNVSYTRRDKIRNMHVNNSPLQDGNYRLNGQRVFFKGDGTPFTFYNNGRYNYTFRGRQQYDYMRRTGEAATFNQPARYRSMFSPDDVVLKYFDTPAQRGAWRNEVQANHAAQKELDAFNPPPEGTAPQIPQNDYDPKLPQPKYEAELLNQLDNQLVNTETIDDEYQRQLRATNKIVNDFGGYEAYQAAERSYTESQAREAIANNKLFIDDQTKEYFDYAEDSEGNTIRRDYIKGINANAEDVFYHLGSGEYTHTPEGMKARTYSYFTPAQVFGTTMSADGAAAGTNSGLPFLAGEEANLVLTDAGQKRYEQATKMASELNYHKQVMNELLESLKVAKDTNTTEQIKLSATVQKAFGLNTDTVGSMHAFTALKSYLGEMNTAGHRTAPMFGSSLLNNGAFNGVMSATYKQRDMLFNSGVYDEIKMWNSNRNTLMINRIDLMNQVNETEYDMTLEEDGVKYFSETDASIDRDNNEYQDRHRLLEMQEEHDRQLANIERGLDEADHSNEQAKKKIMNQVQQGMFDSDPISQEEFNKRAAEWGGKNYEETLADINAQRAEMKKAPIASFSPVDSVYQGPALDGDISAWRNYQAGMEANNEAFRLRGDKALYSLEEVADNGTVIANRLEAPVEALNVKLSFPDNFEADLAAANDMLNPAVGKDLQLSPSQYATLNQNRALLIEQYADKAKGEIRRGGIIPVDKFTMKALESYETVNLATITGEGKKRYPTAVANKRLVDVMSARAGWMLRSGMTQEVADSINSAMVKATAEFAESGRTLALGDKGFGEEFENTFTKYLHEDYFELTQRDGRPTNAVDGLIKDVGMTVSDTLRQTPGLGELADTDPNRFMLHVQSETERLLRESAGDTITQEFPYYKDALEPGRIADVLNNHRDDIAVTSRDDNFGDGFGDRRKSYTEDTVMERVDPQEINDGMDDAERRANVGGESVEQRVTNNHVEREIGQLDRAVKHLNEFQKLKDPAQIDNKNLSVAREYFGDSMINDIVDQKKKTGSFNMPNNYELLAAYKTNKLDVTQEAIGQNGYSYEMMKAMHQYGQAGKGMLDDSFYKQAMNETLNPNITTVERLRSYLELGKAIPEMQISATMDVRQLQDLGANMADMTRRGDQFSLELGARGDIFARSTSTNFAFPVVDTRGTNIAFSASGLQPDNGARVSRTIDTVSREIEAPEGHFPLTMNDAERTIDDAVGTNTFIKEGDALVKLGTKGGGRIAHDAYTVTGYNVDSDGFHNLSLVNQEGNEEVVRGVNRQALQQNITRNYKGFTDGVGADELLQDLIADDAREDINAATLSYDDMIRERNRLDGNGTDIGRQNARARYEQLAEAGTTDGLSPLDSKIVQNQRAILNERNIPITPTYSDRQTRAMQATSDFFGSEDAQMRMAFLGQVQDMQQSGIINESEGRSLVANFNNSIIEKANAVGALKTRAVPGLADLGVLDGPGFGPMQGRALTAMTNTYEQTKDSLWGIIDSMKPLTNPVNHGRENVWKREAMSLLGQHLNQAGIIRASDTRNMDAMVLGVRDYHKQTGDMVVPDLRTPLIQGEHADVMRQAFQEASDNTLGYVQPLLNDRPDLADSLARTTAMRQEMEAAGVASEKMNFHVGSQYEGRNLPMSGPYAFRDAKDLASEISSVDATQEPERHKALWRELYNRAQGPYEDVDDARNLLGWDSTPDQYVHPFPTSQSPAGTRYADMNLGKGWDDDLNEINRIRLRPMNGDDTLSGRAAEYYNMLSDGFQHNPSGAMAQEGIANSDGAARESILRGYSNGEADVTPRASEFVDEYSWDRPTGRNRPLSNMEVKTQQARDSILESLRGMTESGHGRTVGLIAAGLGAAFVARQWTKGDVVEERPAHDTTASPDSGAHHAAPRPGGNAPSGGQTYLTEDNSSNGVAVQINARNRSGASQEQIGEALQRGMSGHNATVNVHHQDDTESISSEWLQNKFAELLSNGYAR